MRPPKRTRLASMTGAALLGVGLLCAGCFDNNPYPHPDGAAKTFYYSYPSEAKYMDPVRAYSTGEYRFITAIYEPPLQYHYLKRPQPLVPRTCQAVPVPERFDASGQRLAADAPADRVAKVVYTLKLKPDIRYQDHPCFARDREGRYLWHLGPGERFPTVGHPHDLLNQRSADTNTRTLRAADYVHQFKRIAHPLRHCPVRTLFEKHVVGMAQLNGQLDKEIERVRALRKRVGGPGYNPEADEKANPIYIDLRTFDLPGVEAVDDLTLRITLKADFPQFVYWLAMPFTSPVPWEAERFFEQSAAADQNFTMRRYAVGTGPYVLAENRPNYRIVLDRNPNFRDERYPSEGAPGDAEAGLLEAAGKRLPFIDRAVFMLDQEAPPRWNKFMQGYYDAVELEPIDNDLSGQVIEVSTEGANQVSPFMAQRGIDLDVGQRPFMRYYAFNMRDKVFGGTGDSARKLRQAISIALDTEERIQVFEQGRGAPAHGPLPPGIFGFRDGPEGINPIVYTWDAKLKQAQRRPIDTARKLMADAGYPDGVGPDGKRLVLHYDVRDGRSVKGAYDWMNKQLSRLGMRVEMRATDVNRWLTKLDEGNFQFIDYGWYADYPDPENFLFLLYGPNGRVKHHGENYANYINPDYDRLFEKMATMPNGPERAAVIEQMIDIVRTDAPWIYSWYPSSFSLKHRWVKNYKAKVLGEDILKYLDIDDTDRRAATTEWNKPVVWPVWGALALLVIGAVPATLTVLRRRNRGASL